jgi:uncharacterized membrane protein YkvA (DUF1232 family)
MGLKEKVKKLKVDLPAIFLALKEKDTPMLAKILAGITIAYALSPIDLIPDFIPVIGYLDDCIILPVLIAWTVKLIPEEVMIRCRKKSENLWNMGKPSKWYYAIPVIAIWLIVIVAIAKAIIG